MNKISASRSYYLSAVILYADVNGEIMIPAEPVTGHELSRATDWMLAQGIHFTAVDGGMGFDFINERCWRIGQIGLDRLARELAKK